MALATAVKCRHSQWLLAAVLQSFEEHNNLFKFNSCVYPLWYYYLKPAIILNTTTEIPREKTFSKKTHKQYIHVHTRSLTPCCSIQHCNSIQHWGFPISICGFRNIHRLTLWKCSHWLLQSECWGFWFHFFELLGLWFWFVFTFFWGKELFVLVRVDFWIWAACFPGSLARMIHSTLLKKAYTFFLSFAGIQEISAVFMSTVGYCTHTP